MVLMRLFCGIFIKTLKQPKYAVYSQNYKSKIQIKRAALLKTYPL